MEFVEVIENAKCGVCGGVGAPVLLVVEFRGGSQQGLRKAVEAVFVDCGVTVDDGVAELGCGGLDQLRGCLLYTSDAADDTR